MVQRNPINFNHISIHAPRGGSDKAIKRGVAGMQISIHAPRGGSDFYPGAGRAGARMISIHAPRGGSDWRTRHSVQSLRNFNPRSPWGERPTRFLCPQGIGNFNPRSPWGERPCCWLCCCACCGYFNPRSPWGERPSGTTPRAPTKAFQSTLPVGGATIAGTVHARGKRNFNPRSPWGERHSLICFRHAGNNFNPRSPWGERRSRYSEQK